MKYIRTKDGHRFICIANKLYDLEHLPNGIWFDGENLKDNDDWDRANIYTNCFSKQADTIEELCDEFVDIDNHDYYQILHKDGITFALSKTKRFIGHCDIRLKFIGQIMGVIYTDKGLIYVAKMNEKGELELL